MKKPFKDLRAKQIERALDSLLPLQHAYQPPRGWIGSIRELKEMSLQQLGEKIHISRQSVSALEKAEAKGGITIKKLRQVAEGLDCELVYAFIPKNKLFSHKKAVEHTMALEDQAVNTLKVAEEPLQEKYGKRKNTY
jgi:predicted DNA-binding mobile mystery protein A